MHIKSIITASLLALSSAAHAVNVTFDNIQFDTHINGINVRTFDDDLNVRSRIRDIDGTPYVSNDSRVSNTRNSFLFEDTVYLSDVGGTGPRVPADPVHSYVTSTFRKISFGFTLHERVTYSISGGIFNRVEDNPEDFNSIYFVLGNPEPLDWTFSYTEDYGFQPVFGVGGTLEPGRYEWLSGTGSFRGEAISVLRFSMDRITGQGPKPPKVPDAGSTLGLLALALGGLGFLKRKLH